MKKYVLSEKGLNHKTITFKNEKFHKFDIDEIIRKQKELEKVRNCLEYLKSN